MSGNNKKPLFELYNGIDDDEDEEPLIQPKAKRKGSNDKKNKNEHRFTTYNYLVDNGANILSNSEWFVFTYMWRYEKDGKVSISYSEIINNTGRSRSVIHRAIKVLLARKVLIRLKIGSNLTHVASLYRIGRPDEIILDRNI